MEDDDEDNDDDEDEDDDDDDEDESTDRTLRFHKAYEIAKSTDTQGYMTKSTTSTNTQNQTTQYERPVQDLTALSWAAFCTDEKTEDDGAVPLNAATYRIQALDCADLFDRLKLASYMLREKKEELQRQLGTAGVEFKQSDDDLNNSDSSKDEE